ncbi:MAG: hypothetical protein IT291_10050 [Deltaproteobacteria bacterium]|nr:hypothetical protein [Deltaproteobacteria bacterium]
MCDLNIALNRNPINIRSLPRNFDPSYGPNVMGRLPVSYLPKLFPAGQGKPIGIIGNNPCLPSLDRETPSIRDVPKLLVELLGVLRNLVDRMGGNTSPQEVNMPQTMDNRGCVCGDVRQQGVDPVAIEQQPRVETQTQNRSIGGVIWDGVKKGGEYILDKILNGNYLTSGLQKGWEMLKGLFKW